jgi:hypothetical protein
MLAVTFVLFVFGRSIHLNTRIQIVLDDVATIVRVAMRSLPVSMQEDIGNRILRIVSTHNTCFTRVFACDG